MTVNLSPENLTSEELFAEVKRGFEDDWQRAEEQWGEAWNIMDRDLRAYAGNTWTRAELNQLAQEQREAVELPLIRSKINWFTGYQRDNVKGIQYDPIEGSDQKTADQLSSVGKKVWNQGQGQYHFNLGFEDAVKTGLSLFGLFLDLENDPVNGDIKFFQRGFNSFAIDPETKQPDLSDCSWVILRDFVTRDQAKQLLPMVDDEVIQNVNPSTRDDKFQFLRPFNRNFNQHDTITLDQYYRRVSEKKKLLVDTGSGAVRDITDLPKDQLEKLEKGIETLDESDQASFEIREEMKETIQYNILLSGEVVFSGKDGLGLDNKYPFVPILCFFEPNIESLQLRYQGIVRSLVDAQRIYNKRNMKILDVMDKIIYGGIKFKLNAVDDTDQLLQSGTRRIIAIQDGYEMDDVQEMQANTSGISDIVQYSQVIDNLFTDLAGINETLLGTDEGGNTQISGRLAQVRTANGVRANRKIFDLLDFSQKLVGELMLEAIQHNFTAEKIERILAEEPTEQFFDKQFGRFDAVVKQGVDSLTQQDQYYFELVNLKREGIVDVPQSEILRALPLTGKSDLLEAIEQQQQQVQEQEQRVAELEQQQKELVNAQIEESLALASERRSRILSDIALNKERISESVENKSQAALARAKTMAEISEMDTDRLLKVLQFVNNLEQQERVDRETQEDESEAQAKQVENTRLSQSSQPQQQDASSLSNLLGGLQ